MHVVGLSLVQDMSHSSKLLCVLQADVLLAKAKKYQGLLETGLEPTGVGCSRSVDLAELNEPWTSVGQHWMGT